MHPTRKDMSEELQALQDRVRALLRANMGEARRTRALLRDTERKVEEQFGHLNFIETSWYNAAKKFRKEPIEEPVQNEAIYASAKIRSARAAITTQSNAPRSADVQISPKSPSIQDTAPQL